MNIQHLDHVAVLVRTANTLLPEVMKLLETRQARGEDIVVVHLCSGYCVSNQVLYRKVMKRKLTELRHSAIEVMDLSVSSLRCLAPEKPRTTCDGLMRAR